MNKTEIDLPENVKDDNDGLASIGWARHVRTRDGVFRKLFLVRMLE